MATNLLTDAAIRATIRSARASKPPKPTKAYDGQGLYLLIDPKADSALWRFRYLWQRREKLISLGKWGSLSTTRPDVPLKLARDRRDAARRLLAAGTDPSAARKADQQAASSNDFKELAIEWISKQTDWVDVHRAKVTALLENDVYPYIGNTPIAMLTPPDLLTVLRRIEARSKDQALRARQHCSRVFQYAIAVGKATTDPCRDLRGALAAPKESHFPAPTDPRRVGELLRAIDAHTGQPSVSYALKILPHVFVRPMELRLAEWSEIDLDGEHPEWRIPAQRMKMKREHVVPLSRQVVAMLRELHVINNGRLCFPGLRTAARPISDGALNAALRRLGFAQHEMVAHGFRTIASTLLNEKLEADPDAIELQLAHRGQGVRAVYNRGLRIEQRRMMMQRWSDYLDQLRVGGEGGKGRSNVVPMRPAAASA
jgi:integrase